MDEWLGGGVVLQMCGCVVGCNTVLYVNVWVGGVLEVCKCRYTDVWICRCVDVLMGVIL